MSEAFCHRWRMILGVASWVAVMAFGCDDAPVPGVAGKADTEEAEESGSSGPTSEAQAKALSDEEALVFFKEQCTDCHGKGQELHSTWPIPKKENLTLGAIKEMSSTAAAYQSLVNKFTDAPDGHRPSPMPPSPIEGSGKEQLEGLLFWFQLNLPSAVREAEQTYGASEQFRSTMSVNLNYRCERRAAGRTYLTRLFTQALGRIPTEAEFNEYLPDEERDEKISDEKRDELAELVTEGELKDEFFDYGLKIFAQRVGGAGNIQTNPDFGLTEPVVRDLKEEFYQLLRDTVEEHSYKDILLMDKVKVTSNTYQFYSDGESSCADPGEGNWGECTLSEGRSNFFGTVGFLRSTPSSFLTSNNNYKRGGAIHAILRGEKLMAQTDGPSGGKPDPVPECLETRDERVVLSDPQDPDAGKSPRGALAVPREGAVCQGCHLRKYLGVASYVFRPFDQNGLRLTPEQLNTNDGNPYKDLVVMATADGIRNEDANTGDLAAVNPAFLRGLMTENAEDARQCITDRTGEEVRAEVENIGDLVDYMIGDGKVLVHGLARYIPSALSSLSLTNQEVIRAVSRGFEAKDGRLLPVFREFFESETFSCATR